MRINIQSVILISGVILSGLTNAAPMADGASKFLGNITTAYAVRPDFGDYWNQITAENECKWGSIEGNARGQFDFSNCKKAYDWSKSNGGHFKFHALIWGSQYPSWLKNLSVDETTKAIEEWFDAVQKQFPDLEMIDVVNEAIRGRDQNNAINYHSPYLETKIIQALGGDDNDSYAFVTKAFQMARARWPKAILIYNDYNTFQWNVDEGINLVKKIRAAGAPVDAYGQQAHDLMSPDGKSCMNFNSFKATLKKIHDEVGIPLFITEYDIGTTNDSLQKACYQEQIPEFWNAEYVAGVTLWGYIYGQTWIDLKDANGNVIEKGISGIIKNGVDRPAMTWLKDYMSKNKGVNTTGLLNSTPDTVPQAPYQGIIAIPGTVEAENYDVGGQTQSYFDSDVANQGNTYRQDRVDIVAVPNGNAVGYTNAGEWLEYSVNVASDGDYDYEASVATGLDGSSLRLFVDNVAVTDTVKVTKGADWSTYGAVKGTVSLTAGTHILKIAITGSYLNIDKIQFTAISPVIVEPPVVTPPKTTGIQSNFAQGNQVFGVFSIKGVYVNSFQANSIADLKAQMQRSIVDGGVYLVRHKNSSNLLIHISK